MLRCDLRTYWRKSPSLLLLVFCTTAVASKEGWKASSTASEGLRGRFQKDTLFRWETKRGSLHSQVAIILQIGAVENWCCKMESTLLRRMLYSAASASASAEAATSMAFLFLAALLKQTQATAVVKKKDHNEEPWTDPFTYPNGTRKVNWTNLT